MERFLDLTYRAAVQPELWSEVLNELGFITGSRGGLLFSVRAGRVCWVGGGEIAVDFARVANSPQLPENSRMARLAARRYVGFLSDLDLFSADEIERDPFYQQILVPAGYGAGAGTVLPGAAKDAVFLTAEGFADYEHARSQLVRLDELRPHLARSAIMASLVQLERLKASLETLRACGAAAAALAPDCRVLATNSLFDDLTGGPVREVGGRLNLPNAVVNVQFVNVLRDIGNGIATGRSFPIRAQGQFASHMLHVLPLRGDAPQLFSGAAAIAVLVDRWVRPCVPATLLQALFDLTASEADVAQKLSQGMSVVEIARQRQVSSNTVRVQIREILAKTGFHRSSDFVLHLRDLTTISPLQA